ncbi:MAG: hypothetical protein K9M97_06830 [Akkermansiaceae bacterium]|nr:hypothetical protein [Akkermansiaceae bacterium]
MSTIEEIDSLYEASEVAGNDGWQVFQIAWPALRRYHQSLRNLESCLKEHDLLEEWGIFLAFSKRFQFFLSTTPLAPSVILKAMLGWKKTPSPSLACLRTSSPESVSRIVDEVSESFEQLQVDPVSPLWKVAMAECLARHEDGATIAVLFSDNRLGGLLEALLSSSEAEHLDFYPVRATDLKDPWIYDQLMVFGPTRRRFDDGSGFVFKSPRAHLLTLFVPDHYRADIPSPYELAGSPHRPGSQTDIYEHLTFKQPVVCQRNPYEKNQPEDGQVAALLTTEETAGDDEWLNVLPLPRVDYQPLNDRDIRDGEKMETVAGKQVFLSADHVVYLLEDGSAYRLVDHLDEESGKRTCEGVEHVDVDEIGSGDILLFSEEGGGEMIFAVANHILGKEAERFRNIQKSWKSTYISKAIFESDTKIIMDLKKLGAKAVTPGMIYNWRSPLNIGPGSWTNFEALLKYCGLEDRKEEIFQATRSIRSAHVQAGAQLAGRLLEMMRGQSLDQLHAEGKQVFGGTKRVPTQKVAFFVQAVVPGRIDVSPNDLAQPIPIEEGSWL